MPTHQKEKEIAHGEIPHDFFTRVSRRRVMADVNTVMKRLREPVDTTQVIGATAKAATTTRNAGKLTPLARRTVMLGTRGGLYEMRPRHEGKGVDDHQRISLVPRDQIKCAAGVLRGANGVCGHIVARSSIAKNAKGKHYGGYTFKDDAPAELVDWNTLANQAAHLGHAAPAPPNMQST